MLVLRKPSIVLINFAPGKTSKFDIIGKVLSGLRCLFLKRKACVDVNGSRTDAFDCRVGLRQGDNVSSFLFIILMNDFENYVSTKMQSITLGDINLQTFLKLYLLLIADDTLWVRIFWENETVLPDALDATFEYCRNNNTCINSPKPII